MDENKIRLLISEFGEQRIRQNLALRELIKTNSERSVKAFFVATTQRELVKMIELCRELGLPFVVVGLGSKINPAEVNDCLVIKNRSDNIKIFGIKGKVLSGGLGVEEASLEVDSGVSIERLLEYTRQQKLIGLEDLANIPGTVGGNFFLPLFKDRLSQVRRIKPSGQQDLTTAANIHKDDIILSVVIRLKAK